MDSPPICKRMMKIAATIRICRHERLNTMYTANGSARHAAHIAESIAP